MESMPVTPLITTLIFDFGRVITRDQDAAIAASMLGILGAEPEAFSKAYYAERSEYDRGSIDGFGYWTHVASRLGTSVDSAMAEGLVALDLDSWFVINGEMTDLIAAMKEKVDRLVLLSNIPREGSARLRSRCEWISMFDELVLSCEHGVIKPEREIYEICLAAAHAPAECCLLVDDIGVNIEGARRLGMHGHVFTAADSLRRTLAAEYRMSR